MLRVIEQLQSALNSGQVREIYESRHGKAYAKCLYKKGGGRENVLAHYEFELGTRLAKDAMFWKKFDLHKPGDADDDRRVLLRLARLKPYPETRKREMLETIWHAINRRDWRFLHELTRELKREPMTMRQLDGKLGEAIQKYWAKGYKCANGTLIPPLSQCADKSRHEFLQRLLDNFNLTGVAVRKKIDGLRLPEPKPQQGKKQRRGLKPDLSCVSAEVALL